MQKTDNIKSSTFIIHDLKDLQDPRKYEFVTKEIYSEIFDNVRGLNNFRFKFMKHFFDEIYRKQIFNEKSFQINILNNYINDLSRSYNIVYDHSMIIDEKKIDEPYKLTLSIDIISFEYFIFLNKEKIDEFFKTL